MRRLQGRGAERAQIDDLLSRARTGDSGVLVVRGDAGIGKTALLEYATTVADGFNIAHASGVESEMELPFAVLQQLLGRFIGKAESIPRPQASALEVAFGLEEGDAPARFLVSLAALSLASSVARDRPLLCLVDDAHWADQASAQVLDFVARRLGADSVVLLIALRGHPETNRLDELPGMTLKELADRDALLLLESSHPGPLDLQVRDRILAEAHGNPLALLELHAAYSADELAGGFGGLSSSDRLTGRIQEIYLRRVSDLPTATQILLLVAAADPTGDVSLLERASAILGSSLDDSEPAQAKGLLEIGQVVAFPHPLVRSAIYGFASEDDKKLIHRALAEATDGAMDPDRRAWHLAHGSSGLDETIATELERGAGRAQSRGGLAAAAAFLEAAADLTPDPSLRSKRALVAAKAKIAAGAPEAALKLLAIAAQSPLDEVDQAMAERMRAQITYFLQRGRSGARMLLEAAERIKDLDAGIARETYLEAFEASALSGRMGVLVWEVAELAHSAPPPGKPPRPLDLLLDAYVARFTEGYTAGVPALRRAVEAFSDETHFRWLWLASIAAIDLWDEDSWFDLASRQVQLCRDAGALTVLPYSLNSLASFNLIAGNLDAAQTQIQQADAITAATGNTRLTYAALWVACWRGQEGPAYALIKASKRDADVGGDSVAIPLVEYAEALLHNGLGKYESAAKIAQMAFGPEPDFSKWTLLVSPICAELIEACARTGRDALALGALGWLSERTQASGTHWGLGVEARCRALVTKGHQAERLFVSAIEHLSESRMRSDLARAHLVYGEWLRRQRRKVDARTQLSQALDMFIAMEATGFARRAGRELGVSVSPVQPRSVETRFQLTNQEDQVATLASQGLTNHEIGTELFISARTVEYHLHKVYTKLGIDSRLNLASALHPSR